MMQEVKASIFSSVEEKQEKESDIKLLLHKVANNFESAFSSFHFGIKSISESKGQLNWIVIGR
jgi:hypothetical protein